MPPAVRLFLTAVGVSIYQQKVIPFKPRQVKNRGRVAGRSPLSLS